MGLKLGLVRQNQDAEKCPLRRKSERWSGQKERGSGQKTTFVAKM
jgi:hypothetical protein